MSFSQLYERIQDLTIPISTNTLKALVIELSDIKSIKEQWSGALDPEILRGCYIEGPLNSQLHLPEKHALIILSREMCRGPHGKYWRRLVLAKEFMHAFDCESEKTSSKEELDIQIEKLIDPNAQGSPQYTAEIKAAWRALAVLCPEKYRLEFYEKLSQRNTSTAIISASLRIPDTQHIMRLMRPDFPLLIQKIK